MTTSLKQFLDTLKEDYSSTGEDFGLDPEVGRRQVAFKTDRTDKLRARKQEIEELARELGRQPTQEELDLLFGDLDMTDPAVPRATRVHGDYGRQDGSSVDDDFRRADRGPTSRRFESATQEGEQLNEQGNYPHFVNEKDKIHYNMGLVMAPLFVDQGLDFYFENNEDYDNSPYVAIVGTAEVWWDGLEENGAIALGQGDGSLATNFAHGVNAWCQQNKREIDRQVKRIEAFRGGHAPPEEASNKTRF